MWYCKCIIKMLLRWVIEIGHPKSWFQWDVLHFWVWTSDLLNIQGQGFVKITLHMSHMGMFFKCLLSRSWRQWKNWEPVCLTLIPLGTAASFYSAVVGWNILEMSIKSIWLIVLFKPSISLLISCRLILSNIEERY